MRVTVLGFVSRDRNVLPDGQVVDAPGGKGLYVAAALARSGVETTLITWLPSVDADLLLPLSEHPVTIHVIPIASGTVNTNQHDGDQTVATTNFDPTVIAPSLFNQAMRESLDESDVVVLGPDSEEKISLSTIRWLSSDLGLTIMADIGTCLRSRDATGRLRPRWPWPRQEEFLSYFRTVFLSSEDCAPALDAGESGLSVCRTLAEFGPSEIVLTQGSRGAFVFQADSNDAFDVPSYAPKKIVDPTGAGDTFTGAYVARRLLNDNSYEAGRYAAKAAALKLQYSGPLRETAEEIERSWPDNDRPG